jgi:plastocyanin
MSRRIAMLATVALALGASLLFAAPASAGGSCPEPATAKIGTTVGMDAGCFTPSVLHVRPGQEITFENGSGTNHTVSGVGHAWGSDLPATDTATFTFPEAGVYPYFCHYHLGMVGAIVVGDGIPTGLDTAAVEPATPELLGQGVQALEEITDAVEDKTQNAEEIQSAPAAATTSNESSTPAIAVGAAVLGLAAGLVLRGRLRSPA